MLTPAIADTANSVLAGTVAAIVATVILGVAKWTYGKYLQHLDITQIRDILATGRERVMGAEDVFHTGMDRTIPADVLRCAQYNLMVKQLAIALDPTTIKLPYAKRERILEALDWYNANSLYAIQDEAGRPQFVIPPEGAWPSREMKVSHAADRFNKLEAIGWLRLRPKSRSFSGKDPRAISRV